MKHAGREALAALEPLLRELRARPGLRERSTGTFSLGSRSFLHFHEDPKGLFADVRVGADWSRLAVNTDRQRELLLAKVDRVLARRAAPRARGAGG